MDATSSALDARDTERLASLSSLVTIGAPPPESATKVQMDAYSAEVAGQEAVIWRWERAQEKAFNSSKHPTAGPVLCRVQDVTDFSVDCTWGWIKGTSLSDCQDGFRARGHSKDNYGHILDVRVNEAVQCARTTRPPLGRWPPLAPVDADVFLVAIHYHVPDPANMAAEAARVMAIPRGSVISVPTADLELRKGRWVFVTAAVPQVEWEGKDCPMTF